MLKPTPKELCDATGISQSYASMILNDSGDADKSRTPPQSLAVRIFRATNWKHPCIAHLTGEQIDVLESALPPWVPVQDRAA